MATVVGTMAGRELGRRMLGRGEEIIFGRDRAADIRFADEERLSRRAGSIKLIDEGVAITNLSSTHDMFVISESGTLRLPAVTLDQPAAGALLTAGTVRVTWPGSQAGRLTVDLEQRSSPAAGPAVTSVNGRTTIVPLRLNPLTKEFAVALLLTRPRLLDEPAATATPNVPDLTRQILNTMSSYRLLAEFDGQKSARARLTARTHEHLKNLRDKLTRAGLVVDGEALSPDGIAKLLVDHGVLRKPDLRLLEDTEWLTWQEREWES